MGREEFEERGIVVVVVVVDKSQFTGDTFIYSQLPDWMTVAIQRTERRRGWFKVESSSSLNLLHVHTVCFLCCPEIIY